MGGLARLEVRVLALRTLTSRRANPPPSGASDPRVRTSARRRYVIWPAWKCSFWPCGPSHPGRSTPLLCPLSLQVRGWPAWVALRDLTSRRPNPSSPVFPTTGAPLARLEMRLACGFAFTSRHPNPSSSVCPTRGAAQGAVEADHVHPRLPAGAFVVYG